jgi:hypothetical protein
LQWGFGVQKYYILADVLSFIFFGFVSFPLTLSLFSFLPTAQLRVQSQEAQALLASIEGKNLPIKRPNWYKQLKSWAVKRRAALGKSSRDLLKA